MKWSALIGWNIISSLNAVISTNERNQIHNRLHGLYPAYNPAYITKYYRQKGP